MNYLLETAFLLINKSKESIKKRKIEFKDLVVD